MCIPLHMHIYSGRATAVALRATYIHNICIQKTGTYIEHKVSLGGLGELLV